jgi:predicted nuclease with TOPRIM domain
MKLSEAVELYIRLRDRKAEMKAEYEAKVEEVVRKMDTLEAKLLEVFQKTGTDSVKTPAGTAYTSVRSSVSTADKQAFLDFVRENNEWGLLDVRPLKAGVEQFRSINDDLPPGINLREERVVNIRRS